MATLRRTDAKVRLHKIVFVHPDCHTGILQSVCHMLLVHHDCNMDMLQSACQQCPHVLPGWLAPEPLCLLTL